MAELESSPPEPDLARAVARLAALRRRLPELRRGEYRELLVRHEQLAFERASSEGRVIVALNASASPAELELPVGGGFSDLVDELDEGREAFAVRGGRARVTLHPRWARVLGVR